eukprot:TRINITY_DN4782_c0_g1_i1.p1 TRINITY_DN4782_c0_g1~~TRINITY_DN4782_c0_g1_i1.p1  ORF type:complete len:311 (-),score=46.02 TRINITY_DN4782_c0_g1_i1:143-1075(-)
MQEKKTEQNETTTPTVEKGGKFEKKDKNEARMKIDNAMDDHNEKKGKASGSAAGKNTAILDDQAIAKLLQAEFEQEALHDQQAMEYADSASGMPGMMGMFGAKKETKKSSGAKRVKATGTYECPLCNKGGFKEMELLPHLNTVHIKDKTTLKSQVCPVCAAKPGGNPNYKSNDIFGHMSIRHNPNAQSRAAPPSRGYGAYSRSAAPPPQTKRTDWITRNTKRYRLLSNRTPESLWEYLLSIDSGPDGLSNCDLCSKRIKPTQTRGILACGHSFHTSCIPAVPSPKCPLCSTMNLDQKEASKGEEPFVLMT